MGQIKCKGVFFFFVVWKAFFLAAVGGASLELALLLALTSFFPPLLPQPTIRKLLSLLQQLSIAELEVPILHTGRQVL